VTDICHKLSSVLIFIRLARNFTGIGMLVQLLVKSPSLSDTLYFIDPYCHVLFVGQASSALFLGVLMFLILALGWLLLALIFPATTYSRTTGPKLLPFGSGMVILQTPTFSFCTYVCFYVLRQDDTVDNDKERQFKRWRL